MRLVAIHTLHGAQVAPHVTKKIVTDKDGVSNQTTETVHRRAGDTLIPPGTEFDTDKHGIGAEEAKALIASGAARRAVREVDDEDEAFPSLAVTREPPALSNATGKAPNTAPRGPASGSTGAPAPNTEAVGRNAK